MNSKKHYGLNTNETPREYTIIKEEPELMNKYRKKGRSILVHNYICIGSGKHSNAYQLNDREILLKSNDPVKAAIANKSIHRLFPVVREIQPQLYLIPMYEEDWSLEELASNLCGYDEALLEDLKYIKAYTEELKDLEYESMGINELINAIKFGVTLEKELREALLSLLYLLSDEGIQELEFDLSSTNILRNGNKLVLLDIFSV